MAPETENRYINIVIQNNQPLTTEADEGPVLDAASSSYDFTEGDLNSPYIVPSSLND
jgi:hypothetical protein